VPIIFDGSVSATIQIRGKSYTLAGSANITGSTSSGSSGSSGGGSPQVRLPGVKLAYHAPFNDAMSLGTLGSIVSGTQTLIDDIVVALHLPDSGAAGSFKTEWNNVQANLKNLPAPLGGLYTNILANVELRITDIELVMVAPDNVNQPYSKGSVALGFGFDCSQIDPASRSLLGITLQAIGVKLSVGLSA
jgi:hypothetical protein